MSAEPAVRARISPTNEVLFETVEDYLLWTAQISTYGQFEKYFRQAGGKGLAIKFFREARSQDRATELKAVLHKTLCTNGMTLYEAMQKQANQKPR